MLEHTRERGGRAAVRGRTWLGVLAMTAALATACTGGGRTDYEKDADTGAAAPAASPDMSTAKMAGPDSGKSERTGDAGVAGDTLTGRRPAAGVPDSTVRAGVDTGRARRGRPPR